jgi:hypothetical protein
MTTKNLNGDLLDTLNSVSEFLDNYVDVVDGDCGEPRPNKAMSLKGEVDRAYARLERDIEAAKNAKPRTEEEKLKALECALAFSTPPCLRRKAAIAVLYTLEERP